MVFVHIPEHKVSLSFRNKYNDFAQFMHTFTHENKLRYFDMNSESRFPVWVDEYFFDSDHLNEKGSILFSEMLAKLL